MTFKGTPFTPGTVQMAARSLSVLAEVLLPKFLDLSYKAKKSKTKNIVKHIRGLGKTVAEKRAIEGQGLDPPAAGLMEPVTAEELVENRLKWIKKVLKLEEKIEKLDAGAPEENKDMALRVAKQRLAWSFIFQTSERVGPARTLAPSLHLILKPHFREAGLFQSM